MTFDLKQFLASLVELERVLGENAALAAALLRSVREGEPPLTLTPAQLEAATALGAAIDRVLDGEPGLKDTLDDFVCCTNVLAGRTIVVNGELWERDDLAERLAVG